MSAFLTYTGKIIDLFTVTEEQIDAKDIAHSLSLVCRANGHYRYFYSVAQHCLNCMREAEAEGLSARVALACLLHDASECYLTDVISDIKLELPRYCEFEDRLLDVIYSKFGLSLPLLPEEACHVKRIDKVVLWYEFTALHSFPDFMEKPERACAFDLAERPFADVEEEYLTALQRLMEMQKTNDV